MHRVIAALLVSAAMTASSGAMAQRWNHHQNDNADRNSRGSQAGQAGQGTQGDSGRGGRHHERGGSGGQQAQMQGSGGRGSANWNKEGNDHGEHHGREWRQGSNWQGRNNNWRGQGDHENDRWRNGRHGNWNNNWRNERHGGRWNNYWRNDRRWNWRAMRNRDRDRFHLPAYHAPHGYRYHRFYRGNRLARFLFASQFWFDANEFGLPPAYGPYRWVRYYNDALLVNIYTGEIEDVIPNFFW